MRSVLFKETPYFRSSFCSNLRVRVNNRAKNGQVSVDNLAPEAKDYMEIHLEVARKGKESNEAWLNQLIKVNYKLIFVLKTVESETPAWLFANLVLIKENGAISPAEKKAEVLKLYRQEINNSKDDIAQCQLGVLVKELYEDVSSDSISEEAEKLNYLIDANANRAKSDSSNSVLYAKLYTRLSTLKVNKGLTDSEKLSGALKKYHKKIHIPLYQVATPSETVDKLIDDLTKIGVVSRKSLTRTSVGKFLWGRDLGYKARAQCLESIKKSIAKLSSCKVESKACGL